MEVRAARRRDCRWWRPAAGSIFGGDATGRFRAFDTATGKVLWEINLGSPVTGYPVTFAVNGKQYVAVSTGPSLVALGATGLHPSSSRGRRTRCSCLRCLSSALGMTLDADPSG